MKHIITSAIIVSLIGFSLVLASDSVYWFVSIIPITCLIFFLFVLVFWRTSSFVIDEIEYHLRDTKIEFDYDYRKE